MRTSAQNPEPDSVAGHAVARLSEDVGEGHALSTAALTSEGVTKRGSVPETAVTVKAEWASRGPLPGAWRPDDSGPDVQGPPRRPISQQRIDAGSEVCWYQPL